MATTAHGYPYPLGTDRVMDGDDVIHALASAVDTQLGVLAAGTASAVTVANNTPVSVAVTFPVGRFNVAPNVVTGISGINPHLWAVSASAVTASGFNFWGAKLTGTAGGTAIGYWVAHVI